MICIFRNRKAFFAIACALSSLWLGSGCTTSRSPVGKEVASMTIQEFSIVSAARAALLDPMRRDFVVKNATVPDAIRAIKDVYGWDVQELYEEDREMLKDIRVSISLHKASKLECVAALCNQTGLSMFKDTAYVSLSDGSGRNHFFADSGLCFLLSFDEFSFSDIKGHLLYWARLSIVSDVKWFGVGNPVVSCDIKKFVYPDGGTPNIVADDCFTASDVSLLGLAQNKGRIKEINMRVNVGVPDAVKRITVDLAGLKPGCETNHGGAFLRIDKFAKQEDGWLLEYVTGYCKRKDVIQNAGIITVLGPDGSVVNGESRGGGSGGGSDEVHGDFSEDGEDVIFSQKPSQLIWTFPTSLTEKTYDVRFRDIHVPTNVWVKQQRYLDVTAGMTRNEILKLMIMSDDADKRTAALHSLPVVTVEEHTRYLADVKREQGERRAFAVYAVGQTAPHVTNDGDRQSAIRLLLSLLDDPDPVIVGLSLQGLIAMGSSVRIDDVSRVVTLLKAKEPWLRRLSASLLGSARVPADRVLEPLIQAIGDGAPSVRVAAATALSVNLPRLTSKQLAAAPDIVATLVGLLRSDNEESRRAAARALGSLGRLAAPAFSELLTVANREDRETSEAALNALLQICGLGGLSDSYGFSDLPISRERPKGAAEKPITDEMLADVRNLVIKRLGSPEYRERGVAVKTLLKFRVLPPEAMDQLRTLASKEDEHGNVRWDAIEALGVLAKKDKDVKTVAVLLAIADSEESTDSRKALEALAGIGAAADKVVPILVAKLEAYDKDQDPLSVASVLAKYRSEAMPFLIKALKSDRAKVRQASARAMTDIVGDYQSIEGRPEAASGGIPLLDALKIEKDVSVQWYMLQAIAKVLPDSKQAVPILLRLLPASDVKQQEMAVDALAAYEKDASEALPELLKLLHRANDEGLRSKILEALKSIGMSRAIAESIAEMRVSGYSIGVYAFKALYPYPDLLLRLLDRNSGMLSQFGSWKVATLKELLSEQAPEYKALQQRLLADSNLPVSLMVDIGRPAYLGVVQQRIAVDKDDPHRVTYLRAAARALGEKPDRVIKISKQDAGSFKPKSAWPDTDASRVSPNGRGHGDGFAPVIITGSLVMKDGSPAANPAFYNTNDRMLMGVSTRERAEVKYDSKTGRFVFQTDVFAAYSMGDGKREPGPYQTGSAMVLIEADGAEPLTVRFFDEMPDVEITLSTGSGHTAVQKDSQKATEDTSQGDALGSMPEPQMPSVR